MWKYRKLEWLMYKKDRGVDVKLASWNRFLFESRDWIGFSP
jgi:hypothetical protein